MLLTLQLFSEGTMRTFCAALHPLQQERAGKRVLLIRELVHNIERSITPGLFSLFFLSGSSCKGSHGDELISHGGNEEGSWPHDGGGGDILAAPYRQQP